MQLAATVMLLRPGARGGVQVLMMRRSSHSAFAPDAYVFPGGSVEPQDLEEGMHLRMHGIDDLHLEHAFRADGSPLLPCDRDAPPRAQRIALHAAALREVFEESGVLLARDHDGGLFLGEQYAQAALRIAALRKEVRARRISFADALLELAAFGDAGELALFSRWVTPEGEARRFDTYFFASRAPHGQEGHADDVETHDSLWIAPQEALASNARGDFHLVFPTVKHLERIASFEDIDAFMVFANEKPIITIAPDRTPAQGFTLPPELEHCW